MSTFRRKPLKFEAWQVGSDDPRPAWLRYDYGNGSDYAIIRTLEGDMRAERGDWIIRGVEGELYPCKPDIFAQTYERCDEFAYEWFVEDYAKTDVLVVLDRFLEFVSAHNATRAALERVRSEIVSLRSKLESSP